MSTADRRRVPKQSIFKIASIRYVRSGNIMSNTPGATICIKRAGQATNISGKQLADWVGCLPTTFRGVRLKKNLSDLEAFKVLLCLLSEHVRLFTNQDPTRLVATSQTQYCIWLAIDTWGAAEAVATLSAHILDSIKYNEPPNNDTLRLWHALRSQFWNQTHAHLARSARQMGVPFYRLDHGKQQLLQLGQGSRLRLCRETLTDQTPLLSQLATNKQGLHALLQFRGVPLPIQQGVVSLEQAMAAAERIGWPVVLKPAASGKGKGVWVGLGDLDALREAWHSNAALGLGVHLVQQTLDGADHRLLVVNGALMAAAQRQPAAITCNGTQTLQQQIEALNPIPSAVWAMNVS